MRNKFFKKTIAGLITAAMVAQMAIVPMIASAEALYTEDFENGSVGSWTTPNGTQSIDTDSANPGINKYYKLTQSGGDSRTGSTTLATPITSNFVFEADLKLPPTGDRTASFALLSSTGSWTANEPVNAGFIAKLDIPKGGNVFAINSANTPKSGALADYAVAPIVSSTVTPANWHHIKIVGNFTAKTSDVYITSLDGNTEYYRGKVNMNATAGSDLGKIYFLAPRTGGSVGIDNITVRAADASDLNALTSYNVSYSVNDVSTSEKVLSGGYVAQIPKTATLGQTFLGWKVNGGETLLSDNDLKALAVTEDLTIVAMYDVDTNYIEAMQTVAFSTFPANQKLIMSDSTDVYADNTISLSITGEKGTDLITSPDARVNDFNVNWEFIGFRTLNGAVTGDPVGSFPGEQIYCDSYGSVTLNSATETSVNFKLKNTASNYYGKVKATITYNGTVTSIEKPLVILGKTDQDASILIPKPGYVKDYSYYEDGMEGYNGIISSDNKSGSDTLLGGWAVAGSNATRKLELVKEGTGKFLRLSKATSGSSTFAMNIISATTEQVVVEQDIRFNTSNGAVLLKAEAPTSWNSKTTYSMDFDGTNFKFGGVNFATGSVGTWYKLILSSDSTVSKVWAELKAMDGTSLGKSELLPFTDAGGASPTFFCYRIGDAVTGSIDFNNVVMKKAVLDETKFNIETADQTIAIPKNAGDANATTTLTVDAKTVDDFDVTSLATWSFEDDVQNVTITPDATDSHKATLSVANGAPSGDLGVKVTMAGKSKVVYIKLTSSQDSLAFTAAPASISIPVEAGAVTEAVYVAEVRDGQGAPITDKAVTYQLYDKNNVIVAAPAGISLSADGKLTVASNAMPATLWVRANSTNSNNEPITKAVKISVHGLAFDFGAGTDDDVADGYTSVTPDTVYSDKMGYGLVGSVTAGGSAASDKVNGDYVSGAGFAFKAKVTPGKIYKVTVAYKGIIATEKFNNYLTGAAKAEHTALTSEEYTIPVVGDGILDINFAAAGQLASVTIETLADKEASAKPTWIAIGDSTIANNGSWAYTLNNTLANYPKLANAANFSNRGRGGRNLTSYYNEGLLEGALNAIKPGDVVSFSGMGTNGYDGGIDGFKEQVNYYLDSCIAMGAYIIMGSYTPHGAVSGYTAGYNSDTMTFNAKRTDGYDVAIKEVYEARKNEEKFLGYVDIGKITDEAMTAEVKKVYDASIAGGKSEADAKADANAKAAELTACFSDHNHYNATISNLLLPEVTSQVADLIIAMNAAEPTFAATYVDGIITVDTNNAKKSAVKVYVAEYDASGALVGVALGEKAAGTDAATVAVEYTKTNSANTIKVMVWNNELTPYLAPQSF